VENGGVDYFAHFKEINHDGFKTLREGSTVSFVPEKTLKGLVAKNISVVDVVDAV